MPAGRPSTYSLEIVERICAETANGKSMREICRTNENMPDLATVFRWLGKHPEFCEQYARARQAAADYMAEEILEIADDATNDWMARQKGEEIQMVANQEAINRSRLRIDARKWLMAKLQPKKYGESSTSHVELKHSGSVAHEHSAISATAEFITAALGKGAGGTSEKLVRDGSVLPAEVRPAETRH